MLMKEKKTIIHEVGLRLETIQNNLGYTQEQMAEMMDVSKEQYRKYLKGISEIPSHKLTILLEQQDFDVKYLLTGKSAEEEKTFSEHLSTMSKEGRTQYIRDIIDYMEQKVIKLF